MEAIAFIFLLFVLLLYYLKFSKKANNLKLPPSPPKLPIIGNLHQLGNIPHQFLRNLSEKHGPLMLLHLGFTPTVIVSSAEVVEEIKKYEIFFSNRPKGKAIEFLLYGCSDFAFYPYGNFWRQVKKICSSQLLSPKKVQEFQCVREEEVADMVNKVCLISSVGDVVNLRDSFDTVILNMLSRIAIGRRFKEEEGRKMMDTLRKASELFAAFCFKDLFPFMGWMDILTGLDAKLKETLRTFDVLLDEVIQEHKSANKGQFEKLDFVDIMLHHQKDSLGGIHLSTDNIKAILLDVFIGSVETSSTVLEWAMVELLRNPSMMRKAQEEVRKTVGKKSKVKEACIYKLDYLDCVIKESMRLHAPAIVFRETTSDIKLKGFDIPAKTKVWINTWEIHRDPKVWDMPEEFHPERFATNQIDFKGENSLFIPFGFGRRGCPGVSFAMAEVKYILANLLYWFNWDLPSGGTGESLDITEEFAAVIRMRKPLCITPKLYSL